MGRIRGGQWFAVMVGVLASTCASTSREHAATAPRDGGEKIGSQLSIRRVFDTGPSWWTDPEKECSQWATALPMARRMAGCSDDYVGDPKQKCQAAIRKCSSGCDVCQNLKPGQGADTDFGAVRQGSKGQVHATTFGPGLFGGYDTRFDPPRVCGNAILLAKVMVHEAVHACRAAGGKHDLYDIEDVFRRGTTGCYADEVAPFEGEKECGDSY